MGIKPLYWMARQGGIVFASELKAIVAAIGKELTVDSGTLVASMLYYWVPDQRCSLRGVKRLPPGLGSNCLPTGRSGPGRYFSFPRLPRQRRPVLLKTCEE